MKRDASSKSSQSTLTSFFGGGGGKSSEKTPRDGSKKNAKSWKTANTLSKKRAINGSSFGTCPLCQKSIALYKLESHAAACSGPVEEKATPKVTSSKSLNNAIHNPTAVTPSSISKTAMTPTTTTQPNAKLPYTEPLPGLFVFENMLSPLEEADIIQLLDVGDVIPWKKSHFNGLSYGKRWGVHCNLRDRRVDAPQHPLPQFLQRFIESKLPLIRQSLQQKGNVLYNWKPNEANAIDYRRQEGHWLKAHVDDRQLSKEPILNLSLAGDCIMTFRNQKKNASVEEKRVLLKRGTLQILTGKARYDYSHAINHADLLSDRRISITMRESPLTPFKSSGNVTSARPNSHSHSPRIKTQALPHFAWRQRQPKTQKQTGNESLATAKTNINPYSKQK